MPRILHQKGSTTANHSVYQTQAAADSNGLLATMNDHHLTAHGHQTTQHTKTDSINTKLDTFSGHTNNTTAIGDGSTQLRNVPLGYDRTNGKAVSFLVDAAGHQQLDIVSGGDITSKLDSFAGAGNNNVGEGSSKLQIYNYGRDVSAGNFKPMVVNSSAEQIVALSATDNAVLDTIATNTANIKISTDSVNLNVDTLEALGGTTNTKLTEIDAVLDTLKTDTAAIKTAVELLDNTVSGSELQVDIVSSALPSGGATETTLAAAEAHLGNIEVSLGQLDNAVSGNELQVDVVSSALPTGAATQTTLASILAKNTENEALLTSIKTAVEILDNTVSGSELQVDVVSAPTTTVTGTVTANLSATDNAVLDDIAQKLGDVETAVQLLDNAVSGNELQVDVVASLPAGDNNIGNVDIVSSALPTGAATQTTLAAAEVHLGNIETSVQALDDIVKAEDTAHSSGDKGVMLFGVRQSSQADFGADGDYVPFSVNDDGEIRVTSSGGSGGATEAKQDVIETTLTAIETSVQALDNSVDGNYLNVNLNVAGTDVDANSGNKSAASQRVCIATDDVPIALVNTKLDHLSDNLDTIETTLTAIETDQAALEVLHTATNSKIDTMDSVLDNILTKNGEIDAVLDNIKVDTEAIETAVEALNTRDLLATTLVVDGQSISSGGGTHTTASIEITKRPKGDGKLLFLIRVATVSPSDIAIAFLASGDNSNFFKLPLSFQTNENTTTGVGRVATLSFIPRYLKVELTNGNFSSASTCSVHMFN